MTEDQEIIQKIEIESFRKTFRQRHGINLYVYMPKQERYRIPLDTFLEITLECIHEHNPEPVSYTHLTLPTTLQV